MRNVFPAEEGEGKKKVFYLQLSQLGIIQQKEKLLKYISAWIPYYFGRLALCSSGKKSKTQKCRHVNGGRTPSTGVESFRSSTIRVSVEVEPSSVGLERLLGLAGEVGEWVLRVVRLPLIGLGSWSLSRVLLLLPPSSEVVRVGTVSSP